MSIDHTARRTWHGQDIETLKQMLQHDCSNKKGSNIDMTTAKMLPISFKRSFSEGDKTSCDTRVLDMDFMKRMSEVRNCVDKYSLPKFRLKVVFDRVSSFEEPFDKKCKLAEQMQWFKAMYLRLLPTPSIICYPVSRKGFEFLTVEAQGNSSVLPRNSMRFEWKRVESFRNFPTHLNISTLGLARSGFYYTGNGDSVSCFSCGINHSDWQNGDDPLSIHRRLSPSCLFLNGDQSQNVPISEDTEGASATEIQRQDNPTPDNSYTNGLQSAERNADPLQVGVVNRVMPQTGQEINNANIIRNSENQQQDIFERQTVQRVSNGDQSLPNSISGSYNDNNFHMNRNSIRALNQQTEREQQIKQEIDNYDPLGINFDRPKYPAYTVMNVRLSTFQDWPTDLTQVPRDMAIAGYIYAGYEDYVRCFFCGGGLRNWDPGDDPWIEHARWFPRCAFLRQNKGNEFVALVQVQNSEAANGQPRTGSPRTANVSLPSVSTSQMPNHDFQSQPAFQSVVEMGYPLEVIQAAFSRLQQVKSIDRIHAEDIIDIILDNEERASSTDIRGREPRAENEDQTNRQTLSYGHVRDTDSLNEALKEVNIEDTSLMEENIQLKEQRRCKICLDQEANIVLLPCGHLCCCAECAPAMRKCPICRTFVKGTVKAWLV